MTHPVQGAGMALILAVAWAGPLAAQPGGDTAPSATFDVVVERSVVGADGSAEPRGPTMRYRVIERGGPDGPALEVQFQATPPFPGRGPLTDPAAGYRAVLSERHGLQVFDPKGQPITSPLTEEGGRRQPGLAGLTGGRMQGLTLPRRGEDRRRALVDRYGTSAGRQQTRERFVRVEGVIQEETWVDAETSLPLEVSTSERGRVTHRSQVGYGELPDGRYYRRLQRDETFEETDSGPARRMVTTTTMTPVKGGGR